MAVINDTFKFIFFAEPHTGSRTVRDALMTLHGSRETSQYHHINLERMFHNRYLRREDAKHYTRFATIRDPHDLITTDWFIKTQCRETLKKFMDKRHAGAQKDGTLFWRFRSDVHVFMRYETLQTSVDKMMRAVGAPPVELGYKPEYRTQGKNHWSEYWTEREYGTALEFYPDIRAYGYEPGYDPTSLIPIMTPAI